MSALKSVRDKVNDLIHDVSRLGAFTLFFILNLIIVGGGGGAYFLFGNATKLLPILDPSPFIIVIFGVLGVAALVTFAMLCVLFLAVPNKNHLLLALAGLLEVVAAGHFTWNGFTQAPVQGFANERAKLRALLQQMNEKPGAYGTDLLAFKQGTYAGTSVLLSYTAINKSVFFTEADITKMRTLLRGTVCGIFKYYMWEAILQDVTYTFTLSENSQFSIIFTQNDCPSPPMR